MSNKDSKMNRLVLAGAWREEEGSRDLGLGLREEERTASEKA